MRMPKVGEVVVYHDEKGEAHNALVICVFGEDCINFVRVNPDKSRDDSYGRQIDRLTSQVHKSRTPVHGNYWRWPDEEPNKVVKPVES